jgi:putative membrane protein
VRVEAAASPADYVRTAGSIDLLAIRASEMAIARSSQHQSLARRLVTEHGGTSAQLSIAGRRLNLLPSAELLSVHQEQLAALDAAADFDRAYLLLMRTLHRRELALHEAFAERGSSPTLRAVARNAAAMARAHLALIGG